MLHQSLTNNTHCRLQTRDYYSYYCARALITREHPSHISVYLCTCVCGVPHFMGVFVGGHEVRPGLTCILTSASHWQVILKQIHDKLFPLFAAVAIIPMLSMVHISQIWESPHKQHCLNPQCDDVVAVVRAVISLWGGKCHHTTYCSELEWLSVTTVSPHKVWATFPQYFITSGDLYTHTHLSDAMVIFYRISRYDVKTAQYQRGRVGRKLDISKNIFSVEIKMYCYNMVTI